jgi:hypothetical protein
MDLHFKCAEQIARIHCAPQESVGPTLPTWALQQVGSYLGYTGHGVDVIVRRYSGKSLHGLGGSRGATTRASLTALRWLSARERPTRASTHGKALSGSIRGQGSGPCNSRIKRSKTPPVIVIGTNGALAAMSALAIMIDRV